MIFPAYAEGDGPEFLVTAVFSPAHRDHRLLHSPDRRPSDRGLFCSSLRCGRWLKRMPRRVRSGISGFVLILVFPIEKLIQFFNQLHESLVVLLVCDLRGQHEQSFQLVCLRVRLHGAFVRPVAERPVFGVSRYVGALQNGVRTLHLEIQNCSKRVRWRRVHESGLLGDGRAHDRVLLALVSFYRAFNSSVSEVPPRTCYIQRRARKIEEHQGR